MTRAPRRASADAVESPTTPSPTTATSADGCLVDIRHRSLDGDDDARGRCRSGRSEEDPRPLGERGVARRIGDERGEPADDRELLLPIEGARVREDLDTSVG